MHPSKHHVALFHVQRNLLPTGITLVTEFTMMVLKLVDSIAITHSRLQNPMTFLHQSDANKTICRRTKIRR